MSAGHGPLGIAAACPSLRLRGQAGFPADAEDQRRQDRLVGALCDLGGVPDLVQVLPPVPVRWPVGSASEKPIAVVILASVGALLVLWDIDHTLIENHGVNKETYALAFKMLTGWPVVYPARTEGRTEPEIMRGMLARHGIEPTLGHAARMYEVLEAPRSPTRARCASAATNCPGRSPRSTRHRDRAVGPERGHPAERRHEAGRVRP